MSRLSGVISENVLGRSFKTLFIGYDVILLVLICKPI